MMWNLSAGGGVQVVVQTLARQIDPAEVSFHAVTARSRGRSDPAADAPVAIHPLDFDAGRLRIRDRVALMLGVRRTVRRLQPDVVHLHSGLAWMGLAARLTRRPPPFLLEVHDAPRSGRHGRVTDLVEGWWARWLGASVVCHSTSVAAEITRWWKTPADRVRLVALGVDTSRLRPATAEERAGWRADQGISADSVVAIGIGRLVPSKRFADAVQATAVARAAGAPVELVLIGAGDPEAEAALRSVAESSAMADHVHLIGSTDGEGLVRALGASDLLVSSSAYEGFGLTVAEAMACGLPAVATAVGGVTDLVDDGQTGTLVAVGAPEEMGTAIAALAQDPARRAAFGIAGRERAVEQFSADRLARSFAELYRSLVDG